MKSSIFKTLRVTLIVLCASTAIISPAQTKLTTLFSFNGNNGADPHYVNLVQGADGSLYGTTYVSTGTGGTVFKITTGAIGQVAEDLPGAPLSRSQRALEALVAQRLQQGP